MRVDHRTLVAGLLCFCASDVLEEFGGFSPQTTRTRSDPEIAAKYRAERIARKKAAHNRRYPQPNATDHRADAEKDSK